jgi:AcrR family transcriptional regulator
MATASKGQDRRAQRTRQVLRQAFLDVAQEKGMMTASIQEITERANVSRGTFYAHYADKCALIETIVRENFQRLVGPLPLACTSRSQTFHLLIQAVLVYFKRTYQRHHLHPEVAVRVEQAIHEELYGLILTWLQQSKNNEDHPRVSLEMRAQMISWAIFGAAVQWSQGTTTISSEQKAHEVLLALRDMAHLASDEAPE